MYDENYLLVRNDNRKWYEVLDTLSPRIDNDSQQVKY